MSNNVSPDGLVKEVFLLNVSVSVGGRTVTKRLKPGGESKSGDRVEREFDVDETIANAREYAAARKLETRIRGLADKFGVCMEGYGYLASPDAKDRFAREFKNLMETEVRDHNESPGQTSPVLARAVILPIGQVFGPEDVGTVLAHVSGELLRARDWLSEGNHDALTNWLKRAQRLSGLVPALNGNVVRSALDSIREAKKSIVDRVRERFADRAAFDATVGAPLTGDLLAHAIATVEFDSAIEAIDAARGWLEPTRQADLNETANAV
jgi:hypothetical protein